MQKPKINIKDKNRRYKHWQNKLVIYQLYA